MKCLITQSNYIPWKGYFDNIALSDVFVIYDDMQYTKRTLLGVYHKIKGKYLQLYLDEFYYKLNRRYFGNKLFERLILAIAKYYL